MSTSTEWLNAFQLNTIIIGTPGDDLIIGTSSNDILDGNGGDDTINAGDGADITLGGAGDDLIIDDDAVNFDSHDGGSGIDTIDYSLVTFIDDLVTIDLSTETTSVFNGNTETIANFENVEGSQGGETIIGTSGANELDGNGGDDTINAGDGADITLGGAGDDLIIDDDAVNFDSHDGGSGIDTIDYSLVTFIDDLVTIDLSTETTSVFNGNTETIANFENVNGSQGGETIIGDSGANVLIGNAGDDILIGNAGDDIIFGGLGSDVINGTNFDAQGTGERDILNSGNFNDNDIFVLAERQDGVGLAFYNDFAHADYALITIFPVTLQTKFNCWVVHPTTLFRMSPSTVFQGQGLVSLET